MMSSTIRYSALGNCRRKRGLITDYATAVVSCQAASAGVDLWRGSTAWRHSVETQRGDTARARIREMRGCNFVGPRWHTNRVSRY